MDAESDSDADQQETTEVAEEEQEVVKKEKKPKEKNERKVVCKACDKHVVVSSAISVPKTECQKKIFVDLLLGCDEESAQEILDNKWRGKWVCKYHVPGMRIYSRKPKQQEYTESEPESELELVLEKEDEGVVPVVPIEPIEREYSLRQRAQRSYKDDLEDDAIAQLEEAQKQYLLEQQMIQAGILPAPIEKTRKTPVKQQIGKYRYHCQMCDKRSRAPCLYIPREPWQRAKFLSFVSLSECTREMRREIMEGKWLGQRICAFHAPEWTAWKQRWSKPMSTAKQSVGGTSSEGIQAECKRELDEREDEKPTISILLRETGLVKLEEPDPHLTGELGTERDRTPSSASEGSSPVNGTSDGGGSGNAEFNFTTCQVCGQKRCSPAFVVPKSPWWKAKFVSCLFDCPAEVKQEMMEAMRPKQRICASHAPAWFEWKARWKKQETSETPNSMAKELVPAKSTVEAVSQSARLLPNTGKMPDSEKPVHLPFRSWSSPSKYQNGRLLNEPFPLPASAFYCVLCETNVHQPLLCVPRPGQKLEEFVERLVGCTEETKKRMTRGEYSQMPICGHHAPGRGSRKRSWDHDRTGDRSEGRVVPIQPKPTRPRRTIQTPQLPAQCQSVSVPTSTLFRNVKREIGETESSQPHALSYHGKRKSAIDEELEDSEETARPISEDVVRFGGTATDPTWPPRLCIVCRQIVTCAVYGVPKEPWQRRKLVECMTDCDDKIKEGILAGRLYRTSFCTKHAPGGGEQWNVSHPQVLEELHDLFTSGPSHTVSFYEKILYKLKKNKHQSATVRDGDEYTVQKLKTEIKTEDDVEETGTSFPASQVYGNSVTRASVRNASRRIDPSVVETVKREIKTEPEEAEGAPTSSISERPAQAQGGLNQYPIPIPVPKPIPRPGTADVMPNSEEDCSRVRPITFKTRANQASKPIVTKTFPKLLPRPSSVKVPLPRSSSAKVPLPRPSSAKVPLPRPSSGRVTSHTGEELVNVEPKTRRRGGSSTTTPVVTQHFRNLPNFGPGPSSGRVIASGGGEDCSRVRPTVASKVGSSPSHTSMASQPAAAKPFPKLLPKPSGTVISNSGEDSRDSRILPTTTAYPMGPVVIKPSELPTLLQGSHVKVVKFLPYSRPQT